MWNFTKMAIKNSLKVIDVVKIYINGKEIGIGFQLLTNIK